MNAGSARQEAKTMETKSSPLAAVGDIAPDQTAQAPRSTPGAALVGRLVDQGADGWWVSLGGEARLVAADPSVDPALLAEAHAQRARVVVEDGPRPAIVGVLLTSRPIVIDRAGVVDVEVERFSVTARREAILKSATAFLRLSAVEAEVYGVRVIARARETAKILARMIALN
jgi:hypothetical protein